MVSRIEAIKTSVSTLNPPFPTRFDAYANKEFKRLAMGRLLGDLRTLMDKKAADPLEKTEKMRLAVYACHDTSLGGIL